MAIRCPSCGRAYDVTRFQFGRTIRCACGARVGLEFRVGPRVTAGQPRFIADVMLGRLARWLRALGYDTAYDDAIEDAALVRRAVEEGRTILTRDRKLPREWRVAGVLVLESERPLDQLREVVARLGLAPPAELFTRCLVCNGELVRADAEAVGAQVPSAVRRSRRAFVRCPDCGRVYWEGSHTRRMRAALDRALGGA